jgi:hypothetical protein
VEGGTVQEINIFLLFVFSRDCTIVFFLTQWSALRTRNCTHFFCRKDVLTIYYLPFLQGLLHIWLLEYQHCLILW